jgi:hypothetical protein
MCILLWSPIAAGLVGLLVDELAVCHFAALEEICLRDGLIRGRFSPDFLLILIILLSFLLLFIIIVFLVLLVVVSLSPLVCIVSNESTCHLRFFTLQDAHRALLLSMLRHVTSAQPSIIHQEDIFRIIKLLLMMICDI